MGLAKCLIIEFGQILKFENHLGRPANHAAHGRFTFFFILDQLPSLNRVDVPAPKCGAAIGIIKIGVTLVEQGPDLESVSEPPASSMQGSLPSLQLSPFTIGLNLLDQRVVRSLVCDLESDSFEKLRHRRSVCRRLLHTLFRDLLAHRTMPCDW